VRGRNVESLHERGDVVGKILGGVSGGRFVADTGAPQIDRDAGEMFGVLSHLECVTSVVGCEKRNEDKWFTGTLLFVVQRDIVDFKCRHGMSPGWVVMPGVDSIHFVGAFVLSVSWVCLFDTTGL